MVLGLERTCPSLVAVTLQWRAAEHVSASVRTEEFFVRLSADDPTYIYVCMSCAMALHKHIYEEGEIILESLQLWLDSHEGGLPAHLQADIGGEKCMLARPDAGKASPLERHQVLIDFLCQVNSLFFEYSNCYWLM